jgi:hypothetical protein
MLLGEAISDFVFKSNACTNSSELAAKFASGGASSSSTSDGPAQLSTGAGLIGGLQLLHGAYDNDAESPDTTCTVSTSVAAFTGEKLEPEGENDAYGHGIGDWCEELRVEAELKAAAALFDGSDGHSSSEQEAPIPRKRVRGKGRVYTPWGVFTSHNSDFKTHEDCRKFAVGQGFAYTRYDNYGLYFVCSGKHCVTALRIRSTGTGFEADITGDEDTHKVCFLTLASS